MRSGRHDRLPASELAGFKRDLEREARLEGVSVAITTSDRGDGTVDVEWSVGAAAATPMPSPAPVAQPSAPPLAAAADPPWFTIARGELGQKEAPGGADNPRIVEYHSWTSGGPKPDDVPWCGAFVAFCLGQAGVIAKGKGSARAVDWLGFGDELDSPRPGCVVVLRPQSPEASGHVAFWVETRGNMHLLLGGNQSDAVTIQAYGLAEVREGGFRWPRNAAATAPGAAAGQVIGAAAGAAAGAAVAGPLGAAAGAAVGAIAGAAIASPSPDLATALRGAAARFGVPVERLAAIASAESSFRLDAKNSNSSAFGLFQFLDGTWRDTVAKHGAALGVKEEQRRELDAQCLMGAAFLADNAKFLRSRLGREATGPECYAAHFFGMGTAARLLSGGRDLPADQALGDSAGKVIGANRSIFITGGRMRTVGEVMVLFEGKMARGTTAAQQLLG